MRTFDLGAARRLGPVFELDADTEQRTIEPHARRERCGPAKRFGLMLSVSDCEPLLGHRVAPAGVRIAGLVASRRSRRVRGLFARASSPHHDAAQSFGLEHPRSEELLWRTLVRILRGARESSRSAVHLIDLPGQPAEVGTRAGTPGDLVVRASEGRLGSAERTLGRSHVHCAKDVRVALASCKSSQHNGCSGRCARWREARTRASTL